MAEHVLPELRSMREDLLRHLILASGAEKAEILAEIMDLDELIGEEETPYLM